MRATALPILLLAIGFVAGTTRAADIDAVPKPATIRDIDDWIGHQRDVRAEFETSKRWAHVKKAEKQRLYAAQDEAFALLEGHSSIDELGTDERIALYNAQGVIAAVVTNAELDREVCKREKVLGSHRANLVCMTERERRRIEEADHDMLLAPRNCRPTGLPDDPCNQG